jgi:hypothetical protein
MGDNDSAFGEKILDISEAQAETMVNPDGVADDFWREPMAIIARPATFHRTSLSVPAQIDNARRRLTKVMSRTDLFLVFLCGTTRQNGRARDQHCWLLLCGLLYGDVIGDVKRGSQ